jgi:RNA polymerase sigma-70 factor (ECF subfamily)
MRELVERAQRGDHDAFARLLASGADRLYAIAFLTLRDRVDAEDADQDACLKAWRDLPGLRDADRYDAWIRRILVRACVDQLRRRRRRPTEVALLPLHAPSIPDPSGQVAAADELSRAFIKLSAEHRAVVVLSHFADLTASEIASTLDIPVGTVKSRLHHALRALRAALDSDARAATGATESYR